MDETLKKLQQVQIEILNVIDTVCRQNGLRYSLYAGTLLGAVRHKGFIPWDDDLDVCMPREDYEKFIQVWSNSNTDGYVLQNKRNTPSFSQSFTKIRKDRTCFLQSDAERGQYHTGIFVDVFPIDRIPNGKFKRMLYKWNCMRYQLYTREFVPPKENGIIRLASKILLGLTPAVKRLDIRIKLEEKISLYNKDLQLDIIFVETMSTIKKIMPASLLDEFVWLQFENREYMCFKMWNEYLTLKYGNYMQLPPKEERVWKHHPIMIDFEHNYEELEAKN